MRLLLGDALTQLKLLEAESVDMFITSPPYYGLRNYGTAPVIWGGDENCEHQWGDTVYPSVGVNTNADSKGMEFNNRVGSGATVAQLPGNQVGGQFCSLCNAWKGELGSEPTVQLYVSHLLEIFAEVKRVLKKTGTFWLNIGDTYAGTGSGKGTGNFTAKDNPTCMKQPTDPTFKSKSQYAVPERLVLGLIDLGFIKRNSIIWHKPSCLPSSATDRFTNDFEYLYFFVKSESYYFEQQFEPYSKVYLDDKRHGRDDLTQNTKYPDDIEGGTKTRNNIFKGSKIKGWKTEANEGLRYGGDLAAAYKGKVPGKPEGRNKRAVWSINPARTKLAHFATFPEDLIETPIKAGCPVGGIVLDCFAGTSTTGAVALRLQRDYIGIEPNPQYFEMSRQRLEKITNQNDLFEKEKGELTCTYN